MTILLSNIKTPIGVLHFLADNHIVCAASFSSAQSLLTSLDGIERDEKIATVKSVPVISELLASYFDGDIRAIDSIEVRQKGAPFSQKAWKAMRKIRAGKTLSYADLADRSGSPAAIRAAGSACAKNAIVLIVPCHRIVKTGGALGNYAYGLDKKEWLLRHEGALA